MFFSKWKKDPLQGPIVIRRRQPQEQQEERLQRQIQKMKADMKELGEEMKAMKQDLKICKDICFSDKENLIAIIKKNPMMLQEAPDELKQDVEVIEEAVQRNPESIQFMDIKLRNDSDFFTTLFLKHPHYKILDYIGDDLKCDADFFLSILREGYLNAIEYASQELLLQKSFVLQCHEINPILLKNVPDKFFYEYDNVKELVQKDGLCLRYASHELQGDKTIVNLAVNQNVAAFQYASEDLRKEVTFNQELFRKNKLVIAYVDHTMYDDLVFMGTVGTGSVEFQTYATERMKNVFHF